MNVARCPRAMFTVSLPDLLSRAPARWCPCRVRCRCPAQQSFGAQVFVEVRPVDAIAAAAGLPDCPLFGGRVEEAGIPGEGHRDGAAIHQVDAEAGIVARTSATRSSAILAEIFMPCLQQRSAMRFDEQ